MKQISPIIICFLILSFFAVSCSAKQAYVHQGDIAMWGNVAVTQDNPDYVWQTRLAYLQAAGKAAGVYDIIDPNLKTWDNTKYPLGVTCFWEHIDLVIETGVYEYATDYLVVLRPTNLLLSVMDMQAAINKKIELGEIQALYPNDGSHPEFYVITKWMQTGAMPWATTRTKAHWAEAYGVDYNNEVDLKAAQWSPCIGQYCHYDFTDWRFWLRDFDCSSSTWYYLWWGYYCKGDPNYGAWLIAHPGWVDAADCLAPGQVADYLISHGYATISGVYR